MPSACRTARPSASPGCGRTGKSPRTAMDSDLLYHHYVANELVGRIHDRMPAILRPEYYARWLDPAVQASDLLAPFPAEPMTIWPISTRVNSPNKTMPSSWSWWQAPCGEGPPTATRAQCRGRLKSRPATAA